MTFPKISINQKNKEIKIQTTDPEWKVLYDCSTLDLKIKCKKFELEADESISLIADKCNGQIYINTTEEMERKWRECEQDFLEYVKLGEEKYREMFYKKLKEITENAGNS